MQAIILAAGMGKRLGELTKGNTKCMVKVNGVTLIERLLHQLDQLHLNKIVMVVGYKATELQTYISTLKVNTPVEYVENAVYDKTNNIYSLYLAKQHLVSEDTLLFESDLIVEDAVIRKLVDNPYPDLALVAKFESWMDGTVVTLDDDNNILRFIPTKSFKFEEIPSYYKTVNIYKFSKEFSSNLYVPFLEAYCSALGKNEYYEQVLRVITLLDKPGIKALPLDGEHWYEIDDIQDLDIAESIFSADEDSLKKISSRYGGYWRYPAMLDYCYLVNPYFPNSRLVAELKANFDRLLCEYPSGLRVNNLLAAKDFGVSQNYICVGNGAAELIKSLMGLMVGKVGVIRPTFEEYPNRLGREDVVEFHANYPDYHYTAQDIIAFYSDKDIQNLILINPDNPSGNYIPHKDVLSLCKWCEARHILFIVDESFVDFSEECATLLRNDILEQYGNLVVMKSISKSYGVPGLRLGIIASANKNLIESIAKDVAIWNINSFAEFYLQIYGKYQKDYETACMDFRNERNRFEKLLTQVPYLRVIPTQANYFLCEITGKYTPKELSELLLQHYRILIKDCSSKVGGRPYIRLAVRNTEDNDKLINALMELK